MKEIKLIDSAASPEDWNKVFAAIMAKAQEGDVKAAVFVFERRFGKPRQTVDISGDSLINYSPTWITGGDLNKQE